MPKVEIERETLALLRGFIDIMPAGTPNVTKCLALLDAALAAQPAPAAVPPGMVLVPVEPTQAMLDAFHAAMSIWINEEGEDGDIYRAMIAAGDKP